MDPLERSRSAVPHLIWRDSVASTNSELVRLAGETALETFTTLVTTDQTAGRGRLDRVWVAPAGTALAVSVLVRADITAQRIADALGWLPLAAGVAMADAVAEVLPSTAPSLRVGVKWPNDVLLDDRKVCGILSELVPATAPAQPAPAPAAVVIGAGLNVTMSREQLPVPTATSLLLAGAEADRDAAQDADRDTHRDAARDTTRHAAHPAELFDRVLAAYLHALTERVTALWRNDGDPDLSGLREAVVTRCTTIGKEVRAELPGGQALLGRAVGIDRLGRLEVRGGDGRVSPVAAGDIVHLRSDR